MKAKHFWGENFKSLPRNMNPLGEQYGWTIILISLVVEPSFLYSRSVEGTQESMIGMMRRYIFAQYPHPMAVKLFSGLLHCIADLQELTWIKKQRQLAGPASHIANDKVLTDANKPTHFKQ